jgi:hypothetical protein
MFFRQGPPAMIAYLDPGQAGFGYNRAVIGVRSRVNARREVRLRLITFDKSGAIIESAANELMLPPKKEVMATLNYKVPWGCNACCLDAALFVREKKEILIGHEEVNLDVPKQALSLAFDKKEYANGNPIAWGRIELGVGELRLRRFKIILTVAGAKGDLSRAEINKPKSRLITFALNTSQLPTGSYKISAELREGEQTREKTSTTIDITP